MPKNRTLYRGMVEDIIKNCNMTSKVQDMPCWQRLFMQLLMHGLLMPGQLTTNPPG